MNQSVNTLARGAAIQTRLLKSLINGFVLSPLIESNFLTYLTIEIALEIVCLKSELFENMA